MADIEFLDGKITPAGEDKQVDGDGKAPIAVLGSNYKEKRISEYPPIGDQLDALFHAGVFPKDMEAKLQAVKDKYPKEE